MPVTRVVLNGLAAAVAAVLLLPGPLLAVVVNFPAGPVQPKAGCTSGTADFCDLRIYQVMVESFVDGDPNRNYNAGYGTSHHKGDLRGIINSLDYIKSSGMNAIWLTPVFDSHAGEPREGGGIDLRLDATGYYTRNYFKIDPKFGSLDDARELVDTAHSKGMYVFFDGVFGHHKGNLVPSPTGKLPVNSSPGLPNYNAPATLAFYQEVATYWINELGIDGWRLDQAYQVPPSAWRAIRASVESASQQRASAGHEWGTLGYMVAEVWSGADFIADAAFGTNANPVLYSAFDFPVRYAIAGVVAGEESGLSGRPAWELAQPWSYGAHDNVYPAHALPNLMLGNHDLVRFGDLLQRVDLADPTDAEYWQRHRLAFMVQAAYTGPITRYYGEEIGDEVPNYADRVTNNCANLGLCDDHVARTSAKILGVTVTPQQLSADQHALLEFHERLMDVRSQYKALSHGSRQHLYSNDVLYVDLKAFGDQEIVFAMNVSNQPMAVDLHASLFDSSPVAGWDIFAESPVAMTGGYLRFVLQPLSAAYIALVESLPTLLGDYNGNGVVDAADFSVWRRTLGQAVAAGSGADGNFNGTIDQGDYAVWQSRFGHMLGAGTMAGLSGLVPEPAAAALMISAALLVTASVPRRRNRSLRGGLISMGPVR